MHKSTVLALLALGAAGAALAQEQGRVLSSTPIIQQVPLTRQICNAETVYSGSSNSGAGAILGAIAGGAIGNSIGGGSGRAAATALGIVGGALVGNQVEGAGQPRYENVQRCHNETYYESRTVGYNVVYEFAGRQYSTQTSHDPGRWIAVNVQPASQYGNTYNTYNNAYPAQPGVVQTYPAQPPAPVYVNPPTTIEYNYYNGRPYYRDHHRPYWR
jgi:uncharacterized protein YcfJ